MRPRDFILAAAFAALPGASGAADDPYTTTIKLVQEQLHILGFYSGTIDGNLAGDTQAALAQFQLSRLLPADGAVDKRTLDALGVAPEESASTGASAPSGEGAAPENPAAEKPATEKPAAEKPGT